MFIFGFYKASCITKKKLNLFENKEQANKTEKMVLEYTCIFASLSIRNDSLSNNKSSVHLCSLLSREIALD